MLLGVGLQLFLHLLQHTSRSVLLGIRHNVAKAARPIPFPCISKMHMRIRKTWDYAIPTAVDDFC